MKNVAEIAFGRAFFAPSCLALIVAVLLAGGLPALRPAQAQFPMDPDRGPEPDPPEGQEYTGAKKCASCHFQQFMTWKSDPHAKVFDLLPAEYQKDEKCLQCHSTGYGKPGGFKDIKSTPELAGNTCEVCHGPGSKHEEAAQKYGKEKLTAEQEKEVRDMIWLQLPQNVCVRCHLTKAHKESETPKELRVKYKR